LIGNAPDAVVAEVALVALVVVVLETLDRPPKERLYPVFVEGWV
jgi:hypothetical protein